MSNKISEVVESFMSLKYDRCGNTRTDGTVLRLNDDIIAKWMRTAGSGGWDVLQLWITTEGSLVTSKLLERFDLISFCSGYGCVVEMKDDGLYLNGEVWDGSWTKLEIL